MPIYNSGGNPDDLPVVQKGEDLQTWLQRAIPALVQQHQMDEAQARQLATEAWNKVNGGSMYGAGQQQQGPQRPGQFGQQQPRPQQPGQFGQQQQRPQQPRPQQPRPQQPGQFGQQQPRPQQPGQFGQQQPRPQQPRPQQPGQFGQQQPRPQQPGQFGQQQPRPQQPGQFGQQQPDEPKPAMDWGNQSSWQGDFDEEEQFQPQAQAQQDGWGGNGNQSQHFGQQGGDEFEAGMYGQQNAGFGPQQTFDDSSSDWPYMPDAHPKERNLAEWFSNRITDFAQSLTEHLLNNGHCSADEAAELMNAVQMLGTTLASEVSIRFDTLGNGNQFQVTIPLPEPGQFGFRKAWSEGDAPAEDGFGDEEYEGEFADDAGEADEYEEGDEEYEGEFAEDAGEADEEEEALDW